MLRRTFLAATAAVMMIAGAGLARAESAADFYKGEVIHFVVGYGPGGGFDQYARLMAPHLEKATGATVIVENRPGGGGMTAINQVQRGKADGLTIAIVNGVPAALGQITESPAVRFDMREMTFLGRVSAEAWTMLASGESPYRSLADMIAASRKGETLTFSGIGRADGPTDTAAVVCAALDLACKMIVGYKGSSEAALAAMRGDAAGFAVTDRSARDYAQGGKLVPVAIVGRKRSPLMPDVPTVFEAAEVPKDKAYLIDFRSSVADIGRALVTVPGTPGDRVAFLRQAVETVLTDPAVLKEAELKELPIDYAPAEQVKAAVDDAFGNLPEERLAIVRSVLLDKYF
ncbi:Bug family tripartite tricarboxylate transporter substrate binding protein [Azospirillum sp. ST 5-10]|uniref:Bug family tripartite tricarboxylate transporter substrate binding protein n=1 Tax=unclassified Azospirillum TaxID=2630922 RepID=UPI003F4A0E91